MSARQLLIPSAIALALALLASCGREGTAAPAAPSIDASATVATAPAASWR